MDLSSFLNEELALMNLTLKDINSKKYTLDRYSLIERMVVRTELENLSMAETIRTIRKTKIKFTDSKARKFYRDIKGYQAKARYAPKLSEFKNPDISKIPKAKQSEKDSTQLSGLRYTFEVYLYCPDEIGKEHYKGFKQKEKKYKKSKIKAVNIPKNAKKLSSKNQYTSYTYISFTSDTVLNSYQVNNYMLGYMLGEDMSHIENTFNIANSDNALKNRLKACQVVGFKYAYLYQV